LGAPRFLGRFRFDWTSHDPETFAAGLAVVLADYPAAIVEYAADPRTGVVSKFPMGLPNVGQIKEYCDGILARQERLAHYSSLPKAKPYEPPLRAFFREERTLAAQEDYADAPWRGLS
jgi:hypothetical protein